MLILLSKMVRPRGISRSSVALGRGSVAIWNSLIGKMRRWNHFTSGPE